MKMKFIIVAALLALLALANTKRARRTKSHTLFQAANRATNHQTSTQTTDSGTIYYLDRHNINCSSGAISSFKLERPNRNKDNVYYSYSCITSDAITGPTKSEATGFTTYEQSLFNPSTKTINYLDRQHVNCGAGRVMKQFRMGRNKDHNKINYRFECVNANILCCKQHETPFNDMGSRRAYYLDRHRVGMKDSTVYALNSFKLQTNDGANKMSYVYNMCKLKDMDAEKAVTAAQLQLKTNQDALRTAQTELQVMQNRVEALKKQVMDNEVALTTAQHAPGLSASC